jgi:glycosyltransferase involved in cell wall biosynthesis
LQNAFLTDSLVVQSYYSNRFGITPPCIPYGSEIEITPPGETLERFGLEAGKYILFVGRLVPENYVKHLVSAFQHLDTELKCVIVGDASYAESYKSELLALAEHDPRIIFTGYLFGNAYHELGSNAYIFVETSGVGGTHPALVEAMAFGNCVVVHNTPENLETIGDAGFAYDGRIGGDSLVEILRHLFSKPELVAKYRLKARQRAAIFYTWERVTDAYERLFFRLLNCPIPERLKKSIEFS